MVCYKYSNVRGEFHFWGVNSNLTLTDFSLVINASFCDDQGAVMIRDARNVSRPVDLNHVRFTFTRDVTNGEKPHTLTGMARSNGRHGCGYMRLHRNSKYRLELDAGLSYYPYSSYIYTMGENLIVNTAIMPVHGDTAGRSESANCDSIGISLSWCERDPVDLDLFVFIPDKDGRVRPSEESAIYWSLNTGMREQRNYVVKLERDDLGVDESSGRRSYGPETIDIGGDLPVGTYAIMVHVHNPDGPDTNGIDQSRLHGGCSTVSIYSSMLGGVAPNGKFTWTLSPENHLLSDWWHVFNLEVKETIEDTLFQTGATEEDIGGPDFRRYFDFVDVVTGVYEGQIRDAEYASFDIDENGCIDEGEAIINPGGMDPAQYLQTSGGDGCLSRSEFYLAKGAMSLCLDETQASDVMGMDSSMFDAVSGGDNCMTQNDIKTAMVERQGVGGALAADIEIPTIEPDLAEMYFSMVDFDEDGCLSSQEARMLFGMDARIFILFSGDDSCMSLDDFVKMMDSKTRCVASSSQRCVKSVILHNVDMVVRPGISVSDEGSMTGFFPVSLEQFSDDSVGGWLEQFQDRTKQDWHQVFKPRDASMGTYLTSSFGQPLTVPSTSMYISKYEGTTRQCHATWLEVEVLSAADMPTEALPLNSALVTLVEDEDIWKGNLGKTDDNLLKDPDAVLARYERSIRSVQDLEVIRASSGVQVGGMKYFGRRSKILVTAPGYFPQVYDIRLEDGYGIFCCLLQSASCLLPRPCMSIHCYCVRQSSLFLPAMTIVEISWVVLKGSSSTQAIFAAREDFRGARRRPVSCDPALERQTS